MSNNKTIRKVYKAFQQTLLYSFSNSLLNLFFRHNNLLIALMMAKFKRNKIILGNNCVYKHCKFDIQGTGNQITINDNCKLKGLRIFTNSDNNTLVIGKSTIVNASREQRTLFNPCDGGGIFIGDRCLFSNNIELHTTDYHQVIVNGDRINIPQNIYIGSHCWIGLQCLILKGTTISENSIVGSRSLLNKKYEVPNAIIAGNPARVIKECVEWTY